MKRTISSKIPIIEEERAVACCIQNMLLTANSFGISSYWSTEKVVYSANMKSFLGLQIEDQVIGLIYFGYALKDASNKKT
jgi:nitroreductase